MIMVLKFRDHITNCKVVKKKKKKKPTNNLKICYSFFTIVLKI